MVARYNRVQLLKAVLAAAGGLACCCCAWLFFFWTFRLVAAGFHLELPAIAGPLAGLAGVAAAFLSGWRVWRQRGGLYGYHESGLYHDFGTRSGGAAMADLYAHRVTGWAYLLSQLFLGGPLLLFKARTLLASRIAGSAELEQRLASTLATLRAVGKWQGLEDHPQARTEILYLAQMGCLDFSAHKGAPRFKAR